VDIGIEVFKDCGYGEKSAGSGVEEVEPFVFCTNPEVIVRGFAELAYAIATDAIGIVKRIEEFKACV
jgi:hypothetical protein